MNAVLKKLLQDNFRFQPLIKIYEKLACMKLQREQLLYSERL